jgi:cob(I)alamin adenosyltransferase
MKTYTKTGDKGQTALIGGKRVSKNHPRIEAYGTVDELIAHTALLMDMLTDERDRDFLLWILDRLMTVSSVLATESDVTKKIPEIAAADVTRVESRIDEMENRLEPLGSLILPGGNMVVSQCHVARTVCRRAERKIFGLIANGYIVPTEVTGFVNRLSDYFFVLSQKIAKDLKISIKKWLPFVGE